MGISKYKLIMATTQQPRYVPETRYSTPKSTRGGEFTIKQTGEDYIGPVSYTHLTLPTKRIV